MFNSVNVPQAGLGCVVSLMYLRQGLHVVGLSCLRLSAILIIRSLVMSPSILRRDKSRRFIIIIIF